MDAGYGTLVDGGLWTGSSSGLTPYSEPGFEKEVPGYWQVERDLVFAN
jgi:hypothetical protein